MTSVWPFVGSEVAEPISALTQQLCSLQTQVLTLQQQLALLTEQLQKELRWRTSVIVPADIPQENSADIPQENSADTPQKKEAPPASIDRRKHSRVLPLVEYGAQGTYVVISPEEGLLSFAPDSPEWFAWLSTLPSFRFVGKGGRFTAFRGYQSTARTSWWAHRQIHGHSHRRRLGLSTSVTIECLELAASSLQALVL